MVSVEAREDLRDRRKVAIHEPAQATVVIDCAGARPPSDEQLEVRYAERVLDVDSEEADAKVVADGRGQAMLLSPRLGFTCPDFVWNPPNFTDAARLEVRR
jgi:hypothetical protein